MVFFLDGAFFLVTDVLVVVFLAAVLFFVVDFLAVVFVFVADVFAVVFFLAVDVLDFGASSVSDFFADDFLVVDFFDEDFLVVALLLPGLARQKDLTLAPFLRVCALTYEQDELASQEVADFPLQAEAAWAGMAVDRAKTAARDSVPAASVAARRIENSLDINNSHYQKLE